MSPKPREPRVVAELGRPETPEETAARKARDSKLYRQRKTLNNLVLSLIVSLGLLLVIVLAVPRGNYSPERSVDVAELAAAAQGTQTFTLAVPKLGSGWQATQAEIRDAKADRVVFWYAGYMAPDEQFAAFKQAVGANATWVAAQLENETATGTETRDGLKWTVYDHTEKSADNTNVRYGLTTELNNQTIIVYGTTTPENVWQLASAVVRSLQ